MGHNERQTQNVMETAAQSHICYYHLLHIQQSQHIYSLHLRK